VLPPPVARGACAPARGITRSPPPVSLLACSWLSPPRPGFRRAFAPRAAIRANGWSEGARPMAFRLDQAPLVDFCNQHSPRAHPLNRPTPASWWNERALAHVARRLRSREAAGCAGKLYSRLSARASHDDGSLHPRDGWRPRAGSCSRTPCGARVPLREGPFGPAGNPAERGLRPIRRLDRRVPT